MKMPLILMTMAALLVTACLTTAPPGQVQKQTGYNPASSKVKVK